MPLGFRLDVYHHLGDDTLSPLLAKLGEIEMKQSEVVEVLNNANETLTKVGTEIQGLKDAVVALEAAVQTAGENASPELVDAANRVKEKSQALDDLNLDPVPVPDGPVVEG